MKKEQKAFLAKFVAALVLFYLILAARPVDEHVVVPFTAFLVRISTSILTMLGEPARSQGTLIASAAFTVDVKNGCNGVEAMLLLVAAVLAFPASLRERVLGTILGIGLLQAANLFRVVTLFWLGVHHREVFELFHAAIWQTLLILLSVAIFVVWSSRVAHRARPDDS